MQILSDTKYFLFSGGLSEEIVNRIRIVLGKIFPGKVDFNYVMDVMEMIVIKMVVQLVAKIDPKQAAFWQDCYDDKGNSTFGTY